MVRGPVSPREHGSAPRLDAILARAALSEPQREAVICRGSSWSYAEVYDRACRLAGLVAGLGVKKGDRVAFWAANRAEFLEVLFGVAMSGAISAPLDHWWTWSDAYVALEQIRPKILIVGAPQAVTVAKNREAVQALGVECVLCLDDPPVQCAVDYGTHVAKTARMQTPVAVVPSDPALILFTSGSTGRSKGAVHTHGGLMATAFTVTVEFGLREGERTLHFLPLFSSCLEHLIPLTLVRATHVVLPQFDESEVWESISAFEVTHFNAVPTTLRRILSVAPTKIPTSLRTISYASEPMPGALITALIERMPGVGFIQLYGMIEHLCLTSLRASDQLRKLGTVGRPMIGAQLYLLDSSDRASVPGEPGEIVARSPTLFAGYWRDEAATQEVMRGEWMRTGDLGRFDNEGFLTLEGRVKEIIKSGGRTVIPGEVEATLMNHPSVSAAAVVGIPDEQWGEAVHAFVTLAPGVSLHDGELKTFCQEQLPGYKRPKAIHVVSEMPMTGIGKIARRQLRDAFLTEGVK
jgi:acyl-CoA synthetase (AMP-forming)/AMP-acid ligase II